MVEIRHLENRQDVIFFCRRWSDLDKISETDAEWHVDGVDVVEIETGCRIPIWWTFRRIQWHVIPVPPATLQGAATWRIQCHDPRATCYNAGCCHRSNSVACHPRATYHIAGCFHLVKSMLWSCHIAVCKNSIRLIENRFSPYFILFWFLKMQFGLWGAAAFVSSPIHLFYNSVRLTYWN